MGVCSLLKSGAEPQNQLGVGQIEARVDTEKQAKRKNGGGLARRDRSMLELNTATALHCLFIGLVNDW